MKNGSHMSGKSGASKTQAAATAANITEYSQEEITAMQAEAADESLRSKEGWNIIHQFQSHIYAQLVNTSQFVVPVLNDIDTICEQVNDPQAFRNSFTPLMGDLAKMKLDADRLGAKHIGKKGQPTAAELPVVFSLSQDYSNIMANYEAVIQPLINSLNAILQAEFTAVPDQSEMH